MDIFSLNIVDFIIIICFIAAMLSGYRNGFLGGLIRIFGSIVGLIAAFKYYSFLTGWAERQFQASEQLYQFLKEHIVLPQSVSQLQITLPTLSVGEYLEKIPLPPGLKAQLAAYLQGLGDAVNKEAAALLGDILHRFLTEAVINGLAFILIWFMIDGALQLIASLFSRFLRHSVLGSFDRLGGLLLGAVLTTLTLTILLGLATPLLNVADLAKPSFLSGVINTIGEARLVPFFTMLFSFLAARIGQLLPL